MKKNTIKIKIKIDQEKKIKRTRHEPIRSVKKPNVE